MFLASDLRIKFRICIQENKQNSLTPAFRLGLGKQYNNRALALNYFKIWDIQKSGSTSSGTQNAKQNSTHSRRYFENQEEHHKRKTFEEEYREFIKAYDFSPLVKG
jgi:hypothetical protein